jgi:hypothetical protein
MADGIDCREAIEQRFARWQPKIASSTGQDRPNPSAEIAEAFIAGNWQIAGKGSGTKTIDCGAR